MGSNRFAAAAAIAAALLALTAPAFGVIHQPDGTTVPVGGSLQGYLTARGESIDAVNDGAIEPQRFIPGCTIRFQVVVRDTSYHDAFGWYNIVPGRAPTAAERFELVSPTDPVGFMATLDVRTDARYAGGEIGFYLLTTPGYVYFSERDYQPDRVVTGGFVHVLIYDSRVTRNAFYFGWEDLYGGGDNDFQDLLVLVDNLVCAGGGSACDTGEQGVCAAGIGQCRNGTVTCMRVSAPSAERCDGLDNDCDGAVDNGTGLCAAGQVCDRGVCVPNCVEMSCDTGQVCTARGTCVEAACGTVDCPAGQRCVGGACVGACEHVTCPHGQACRAGRCVDLCDGVVCDADQTCLAGICSPRCPCHRCDATETCETASGQCREAACASVTCATGQYCAMGTCQDACAGVACPGGQVCAAGQCVNAPAVADAGVVPMDGGTLTDGGPSDARTDARTATDARRDAGRDAGTGAAGGCNCRATRHAGRGGAFAWMVAAAWVAANSRRRRAMRR